MTSIAERFKQTDYGRVAPGQRIQQCCCQELDSGCIGLFGDCPRMTSAAPVIDPLLRSCLFFWVTHGPSSRIRHCPVDALTWSHVPACSGMWLRLLTEKRGSSPILRRGGYKVSVLPSARMKTGLRRHFARHAARACGWLLVLCLQKHAMHLDVFFSICNDASYPLCVHLYKTGSSHERMQMLLTEKIRKRAVLPSVVIV